MQTQRPRLVTAWTNRPRVSRIVWRLLAGVLVVVVVASHGAVGEDSEEAGTVTASQSELPNLGVLVAGDGAIETYASCIVCHSERLVAQQGLTRQGWEEVIDLMVEEHGMAPIAAPVLDRVLGYLSTHYGPDRPNFPLQ